MLEIKLDMTEVEPFKKGPLVKRETEEVITIDVDLSERVGANVEEFIKPVLLGAEASELKIDCSVLTGLEDSEFEI